jgi:hypothetical protein
MSDAVDPAENSRRHCLARLADEARARGLHCRLTGPDGGLLHVSKPSSGQSTMVFAVPSSSDAWSYLWSGGGAASASDPAQAAELLAASLGG